MTSADTLELAKVAFVACCALLALSVGMGVVQAVEQRPVPTGPPIEWPPTWAEIVAARAAAKPIHHGLHCGRCGQFSRPVAELPGVANCATHGMTARITYLADYREAVAA